MSCVRAVGGSGVKRQISRRMCGRPRKKVESATSSTLSPGFHDTKRYGPSPTGAWPNGARTHWSRGTFASRWAGRMRM